MSCDPRQACERACARGSPVGSAGADACREHSDARLATGQFPFGNRPRTTLYVSPPFKEARVSPEQVALVQSTWNSVLPNAWQIADLFYDRLFIDDPKLRPLFPDEMREQKDKLLKMIGRVVSALRDANKVVPALQELGKRHVGYGVLPTDYTTVAGALLWALEQRLGPAWTPEVRDSWVAAYTLLSKVMIEAAASIDGTSDEP